MEYLYNQVSNEISQECVLVGTNYCLEWSILEVKTFHYFDLFVLFSFLGILFIFKKSPFIKSVYATLQAAHLQKHNFIRKI